MQIESFQYLCRSVTDEGTRLVAYYHADPAARPPAVIIKGAHFNVGDKVELSFVNDPATTLEIFGNEK
jgi:hypothetical protein